MTRKEPIAKGRITEHGAGLGTVTRAMVTQRARELAIADGRTPEEVNEADWAQAHRELMGADETAPTLDDAEETVETEPTDPAPGTLGHHVEGRTIDDEQATIERLVEEGVAEADHDERVQAARDNLPRKRRKR